jgi:hypothetical protein
MSEEGIHLPQGVVVRAAHEGAQVVQTVGPFIHKTNHVGEQRTVVGLIDVNERHLRENELRGRTIKHPVGSLKHLRLVRLDVKFQEIRGRKCGACSQCVEGRHLSSLQVRLTRVYLPHHLAP